MATTKKKTDNKEIELTLEQQKMQAHINSLTKKIMEETPTKNTWRPVVRKSRQIPFGYEADPNDDTILLPIQEQLDALLEAKEYLKV